MPNPFRRHSHSRSAKRRSANRLELPGLAKCSNCQSVILSHRVCPDCGYYDGRPVVVIKTKGKEK